MRFLTRLRLNFARRIHLAFMAAAGLPLIALAFANHHLALTRLEEGALVQSRELAKSIGMDVYERLQFLSDGLTLLAARSETAALDMDQLLESLDLDLSERLLGLFHVEEGGIVEHAAGLLTAAERDAIGAMLRRSARNRILLSTGEPEHARFFLLVRAGDGYIGGVLNTAHLWAVPEIGERSERICILDAHRRPVYCNQNDSADWAAASQFAPDRRARPREIGLPGGDSVLTGSWSLYLRSHYGFERWIVLVGIPRSQAIATLLPLERVYMALGLLAVLLAALLGSRYLRVKLAPLARLNESTRRIAAGDYQHRVGLRTGDEFEELGSAFDAMSERVGRQVQELQILERLTRKLQAADGVPDALEAAVLALRDLSGHHRCAFYCEESLPNLRTAWYVAFDRATASLCPHGPGRTDLGEAGLPPALRAALGVGPEEVLRSRLISDVDGLYAIALWRSGPARQPAVVDRVFGELGIALGRLALTARLRHQATHDWLSGLYNRNHLRELFEGWVAGHAQGLPRVGMLLIDLNRFGQVNDALGHSAGDRLLRAIGDRLRAGMPEGCLSGRFSGDQFLLMCTCQDDDVPGDGLNALGALVRAVLERPFHVDVRDIQISTSLSAAVFPQDAGDFESMIQCLQAAMTDAKSAATGSVVFFSAAMRERLVGRMEVEHGLRFALARNELVLHYQPVVDARSGRVSGAEALVRWQRPGFGLVMPGGFIDVAENSGLIVDIGAWTLREACRQISAWRSQGLPVDAVNVNLSARQLASDRLEEVVVAALRDHAVDPSWLKLEVTESALIDDLAQAVDRLGRLRAMGLRVMLDDFGTGYASLKYLKLLPADGLKIDRLFVRDLPASPADVSIVHAVVNLAAGHGWSVVAEGVETEEQAASLRVAGVDALQGYLFSRPLPAAEFAALLRRASSTSAAALAPASGA